MTNANLVSKNRSVKGPSQDYFQPPTNAIFAFFHRLLLPLVINNDHLIHSLQEFFGVRYRGSIQDYFSKKTLPTTSTQQSDVLFPGHPETSVNPHAHPFHSPFRGPLLIHIIMCLASELGNELFYGVWVLTTMAMFDVSLAIPLLLLWGIGLFSTQLIKDSIRLPRPGLFNYYNEQSKQYLQPIPPKERIYRLESHYAAEFGFPSAHCVGSILGLYTLYGLNQYISTDSLVEISTQFSTLPSQGFISISSWTLRAVQAFCVFWIFMTPISRLYFGVHSFMDIIGGLFSSLTCMFFILALQSFGIVAWLVTTFSGVSTVFFICILLGIIYPKHADIWTNSSGDTFLVLGTAFGCVVSYFVRYTYLNSQYDNILTLITANGTLLFSNFYSITQDMLYRQCPTVATTLQHFVDETINFTTSAPLLNHLSNLCSIPQITDYSNQFVPITHLKPFTYGLIHPPYFWPVDLTQASVSAFFSIATACCLFALRNLFILIIAYILKDLIVRKPLFKVVRFLLGYSASLPPKPVLSTDTAARPQSSLPNLTSPSTAFGCEFDQITTKESTSIHTNPDLSLNRSKQLKPLLKPSSPKVIVEAFKVNPNLPPVSSTLFKYSYDMAIRDINMIDIVDKFVGYAVLGFSTSLVFLPLSELVFGSFYYLYVPQ